MKKIAPLSIKLTVIASLLNLQLCVVSCKKTYFENACTEQLPTENISITGLGELQQKVDHVVVLMLENRSFDNLLGYLYTNKDGTSSLPAGKQFAGLQDRTYICPIPKSKRKKGEKWYVPTHPATDYHAPCPDPGEVYGHVNTQLHNHVDEANIGVDEDKIQAPYNLPLTPPATPPMNGFVNDYISTLQALGDEYENPTYEQYKKIMACFTPDQVPVLATLAEKFAVFDHWHCSVPSQTLCNRAFWHTGTSGGHVINPGITAAWDWKKNVWDSKNLFQLLGEHDISSAVYAHGPVSLTHLVHGPGFHISKSYEHFTTDIDQGSLPQYVFIEPKFFGQHNDQHPSSDGKVHFYTIDHETRQGTVILGEHLIWEVYTAIKNSDQYRDNTLLIITHDEHGGCFDHVAPPAAVPPKPGMKGEQSFQFDCLGLRVPMVMVSSYIQPGTIVNETFDHTSLIKTLCKKWKMEGLTERDKNARSFEDALSSQKRTAWPEIAAPSVTGKDSDYDNDPLNDLQKSMVLHAQGMAEQNPAYTQEGTDGPIEIEKWTVKQAMQHLESLRPFLEESR